MRAPLYLVGVLALAAALGAVGLGPRRALKRVRHEAQRGWLVLTGRLVDAGGHRLHLVCMGAGRPVVLMEAGLNMTMDTWGRVPREVAKFTRVCAYERAGLGWSDSAGPELRTSSRLVSELHALLGNAGVRGPLVLVGHSFGGLNVRLYASQYRDDVAGLVLVDASHEDQLSRLASLMPEPERAAYLRHERGENFEHVDIEASADEVRAGATLPNVPLVVLSARRDARPAANSPARAREEMQAELARLAPDARHVVVEGSGHFIQLDRPEAVVEAVRAVVTAARGSTHVASGN